MIKKIILPKEFLIPIDQETLNFLRVDVTVIYGNFFEAFLAFSYWDDFYEFFYQMYDDTDWVRHDGGEEKYDEIINKLIFYYGQFLDLNTRSFHYLRDFPLGWSVVSTWVDYLDNGYELTVLYEELAPGEDLRPDVSENPVYVKNLYSEYR